MSQQEVSTEVQEIWALFRETREQIREVAKRQEETDKAIRGLNELFTGQWGFPMNRTSIAEIAQMVGLHPNTIRNWSDAGIIDCKRDFRGWRRFPNPLKTVREIQGLLNGERMPKNKGSDAKSSDGR
jgi:hypothetical protein